MLRFSQRALAPVDNESGAAPRVARRAEGRGGGLAVEEDEDVEGGGAEEGGAEDGEDEGQGVHGRRLGVLDIARVSIVLLSLLTRRRGGAARGSGERG